MKYNFSSFSADRSIRNKVEKLAMGFSPRTVLNSAPLIHDLVDFFINFKILINVATFRLLKIHDLKNNKKVWVSYVSKIHFT